MGCNCGGGGVARAGMPRDLGAGVVMKYALIKPDGSETVYDTMRLAANARAASDTGGRIQPKAVKKE